MNVIGGTPEHVRRLARSSPCTNGTGTLERILTGDGIDPLVRDSAEKPGSSSPGMLEARRVWLMLEHAAQIV